MPSSSHSGSGSGLIILVGNWLLIILTLLIALYLANDHFYPLPTKSDQLYSPLGMSSQSQL